MDEALLKQISSGLRKAALNQETKAYILSNPVLFNTLKKAQTDTFVATILQKPFISKKRKQNWL